MVIVGFNKLTVLDYPNEIACIVFLAGCNFRCPFCHNSSIASCPEKESFVPIEQDEVLSYLKKRQGVLSGVVISGGEPLINSLDELVPFLRKIKQLNFKIKLDTNGSFPSKLEQLFKERLVDYVAMDIKNQPKKYDATAGVSVNIFDIMASMKIIKSSGVEYEFRTTLVEKYHSDPDLVELGKWLENEDNYYIQRFVNNGGLFDNSLSPTDTTARAALILKKYIPKLKTR